VRIRVHLHPSEANRGPAAVRTFASVESVVRGYGGELCAERHANQVAEVLVNVELCKDRLAAVSSKPNRMFGSEGCALGVFDLEVASNSIEHGHLSLLDRCGGIVDGERSVFVQQLGIIRSVFNVQIVLPLGYLRL
jgi:hypothetical protein